ncbi:MAG: hypothetical protein OEM77_04250 [Nitrosopumilus sp.]|nr:hypothetical protein [Nitrosopumilus sp.]MDH3736040.1 hypothetical protein [Nitrosopumilus sp.]MDH3823612.1 hypothetical protein [Nitrosopumilus sp.]MDH3834756.1 hypothetical protein [Nitrosopumilus sp.]
MSTYNIREKISEKRKTKLKVLGLLALLIVTEMYYSGSMTLDQIPQILTSGIPGWSYFVLLGFIY